MNNLLGIYEKALPDLTWDEKYRMAKEAGYDFIELSIDRNRLNKLDYTDAQIEEIRNCAAEYGMTLDTMPTAIIRSATSKKEKKASASSKERSFWQRSWA